MADKVEISESPGNVVGAYTIATKLGEGELGTLLAVRADGGQGALALMRVVEAPAETVEELALAARSAVGIEGDHLLATQAVLANDNKVALVSEYSEGEMLGTLLRAASVRRAHITTAVALRVALDLLEGLSFVHEKGAELGESSELRHGGLTPSSVIVSSDGYARLMDLGASGVAARSEPWIKDGKWIAYASPEAVKQESALGATADVFTVGILLWEMLQNKRLFSGLTYTAVSSKVLEQKVGRVDMGRPEGAGEVSSALADVVGRALDRDPKKRFPAATDMAAAIRQCGDRIADRGEVAEWVDDLAGRTIAATRVSLSQALGRAKSNAPPPVDEIAPLGEPARAPGKPPKKGPPPGGAAAKLPPPKKKPGAPPAQGSGKAPRRGPPRKPTPPAPSAEPAETPPEAPTGRPPRARRASRPAYAVGSEFEIELDPGLAAASETDDAEPSPDAPPVKPPDEEEEARADEQEPADEPSDDEDGTAAAPRTEDGDAADEDEGEDEEASDEEGPRPAEEADDDEHEGAEPAKPKPGADQPKRAAAQQREKAESDVSAKGRSATASPATPDAAREQPEQGSGKTLWVVVALVAIVAVVFAVVKLGSGDEPAQPPSASALPKDEPAATSVHAPTQATTPSEPTQTVEDVDAGAVATVAPTGTAAVPPGGQPTGTPPTPPPGTTAPGTAVPPPATTAAPPPTTAPPATTPPPAATPPPPSTAPPKYKPDDL